MVSLIRRRKREKNSGSLMKSKAKNQISILKKLNKHQLKKVSIQLSLKTLSKSLIQVLMRVNSEQMGNQVSELLNIKN
jgi:hypothetical protein